MAGVRLRSDHCAVVNLNPGVTVGGGEKAFIDRTARIAEETGEQHRAILASFIMQPSEQGVAGSTVAEHSASPALVPAFGMDGAGLSRSSHRGELGLD